MIALAQQSNILDFPSVAPQGKSNEWYTPARYIEAAREVMGSIDLDPASCDEANKFVKAKRFYTREQDGLMLPWRDNVWCNPPYKQEYPGHSSVKAWVQRVVSLYEQGVIDQAILLIPNDTSTRWFKVLWNYPICFPSKRIKFEAKDLKKLEQPSFGTCFVYLGPNEQKFIDIFSQFGTIAKRVSQPRHTIATPSLWEVAQ